MSDRYNSIIARSVAWLKNKKTWAITVSQNTTWYSVKSPFDVSDQWRRHEERHKEQYKGFKTRVHYWLAYWKENRAVGYYNNKYEVDARKAEVPNGN